jgi:hypothetical protein
MIIELGKVIEVTQDANPHGSADFILLREPMG